ncbi:type IV conjugative transfer system protein TraL (plasmid) [Acinetobacter indicus]|uniref:type IV conjugative transfer system protein TraL n=1 Tax=Acinetobacter indicus TaxID=756892 RepID=UPI001FA8184B|nr:type IV conjugative transfer system protein TraL [Acinetobacter indicus]UNW11130.1 type IV conjugative transfer system protein TraL [Acinetobacter indicus]
MSAENLEHYVPTKLDDPSKFLIFDQSVAMLALMLFLVGYWVNHPLIGMLIGVLIAYWFNKIKAGYHVGFVHHLVYWISGTPKLKALPESGDRYFFG